MTTAFNNPASMYPAADTSVHPVDIQLQPLTQNRNRLTSAFRPILAIPHILLIGGPGVMAFTIIARDGSNPQVDWSTTTGVLGAVAGVSAIIAWFWILFTGEYPPGLRNLAMLYLRWRVRATAYLMLLTDKYPPFGDGDYPAQLWMNLPRGRRNRVSVAFRVFLVIPQIIAVCLLSFFWLLSTVIAWFSILFSGNFPMQLYGFGKGVLRWTTRVEAYLLLLHDEYPPFSLD
jgi:hypothetical protein